jgi:hypothetical protein
LALKNSRKKKQTADLGLSAISMNHIDIDTIIDEFVKELTSTLNRLDENQNGRFDALLKEMIEHKNLKFQ